MTGEKLKREASIVSSCFLWGATSAAYVRFAHYTSSYKRGVRIYWG